MLGSRTALLIFCFLSVCAIASRAQQSSQLTRVVTIDVSGVTLAGLIDTLSAKSGAAFSYSPKKIHADRIVSFTARSEPLKLVLDRMATSFGLAFDFVESQIIVKAAERPKGDTYMMTISGNVTDSRNGEALIGAGIYLKETGAGAVTNAFGFYSITLPRGDYTMLCSYIGYASRTITIAAGGRYDIPLTTESSVLEEVVVEDTLPDVVKSVRPGVVDVPAAAVEERPSFFGEMDVLKSLESLPGIKMHSDGSTFYYVRGGDRDQNLVLVDDAPIYNPSHLLGLFSTIIPDAVNDITLYKGDMPASLGGRLSSVLDIRTKKGNDQHLEAWGGASLISTKLGIEGPIRKDASSFLISTRFSRLKWILNTIDRGRNVEKFNFYDVTGKVNVRLNENNRIYFSLYNGADNYFGNNSGIAWENNAAAFRWNHIFNEKIFLNTTLAAGNYDYFLYQNVETNTRWNSHISNFNLKADFTYFVRPESEVQFGCSLNGYSFNPGNILSNNPVPPRLTLSVRNSGEFVLYASHQLTPAPRWTVDYGLRFSSWSNRGEAFEFQFDDSGNALDTLYFGKGEVYKTYNNLEPRVTVSYLLDERQSLKASFSRNVQNIHLISNSISPFTSLEVWLPSSVNIAPQTGRQLSAGYYRNILKRGVSLTAEIFYKRLQNQIDFISHAETLLNPLLEAELRFGSGTAYGTELMLKKEQGRFRGWAGYSYSRAKRKIAEINGGKTYNAFFDRPHQANVTLSYDATSRWNVAANWTFSSGSPFSAPVSFYSYNGEEVPVYGEKNNERLPDYHRLDLSATLRLNKNPERRFNHSLSFSIYNFYARKNALFINYNKKEVSDDRFRIPGNLLERERQTSQFFLFRFAPSISYNFRWQ